MSALKGVRVVDFSRTAPGPYCGLLLADLGADVVRVDRAPVKGRLDPLFGDMLGTGKRSVALDLASATGRAVALRLIGRADVLIEGFRPGVMERLGLGPADTLAANPRLVYARVTGWGQTGPMRDRAGHDINYIALSGVLSLIGRVGQAPVPPVNLLGDFAGGGMWAALGVLAALLERERSGHGQVVDAAMVDGTASMLQFFASAVHTGGWRGRGANVIDTGAHFYEVYECADGGHIAVGAIEPKFYAELLDGIGLAGQSLPGQWDRTAWPALKQRFAAIFRTRSRDEWAVVFAHRDACAVPVLHPSEAPDHPHHAARGTFLDDPAGVPQPAPGPRLSRTPARRGGRAPRPGQHAREILAELGYTSDEVAAAITAGAVATGGPA